MDIYKKNELVNFYNSYEEFCIAKEKIEDEYNSKEFINFKYIEENNWGKRVEIYERIIDEII